MHLFRNREYTDVPESSFPLAHQLGNECEQDVCFLFFSLGQGVRPSLLLHNRGIRERGNAELLDFKLVILNVEPLPLPALDGFPQMEVEVGDPPADANSKSADLVRGCGFGESLYIVKLLPKAPMGRHSKEAFA